MNTTNSNSHDIDQFVSTLASILEYVIPANAAEKYEQALYAIYYGTTGDDDLLGFVDLLRDTKLPDEGEECASTTLNDEPEAAY